MVAKFDRHGIRFMYPDNWTVQEDAAESGVQCITVQSPGSAFWLLQALDTPEFLDGLAEETLESFKQDYDQVEVELAKEEVFGTELTGYDLQFYCLDFLVSAHVRTFSLGSRAFVLLSQAEDSEFNKLSAVFQALTASLIKEAQTASA